MIGGNDGRVDYLVDNGMDYRLGDGWIRGSLVNEESQVDEPQLATPTPLRGTVAPPTEALPVVEPATPNSIEGIICSFDWPQGCEYWVGIAECESTLSPSSIGYRGAYVGLFQVWSGHDYGYSWLLDPYNNTLAAWELSDGGIYTGAWPYCQWQ